MNEDMRAVRHFSGGESLGQRIRIKGQKILYYLVTGYWNTGERVHPFFVTNNYINHLRVYQFISQFTAGKQVLDVGCGVGYGTHFLSRNASRAVGIDFSQDAIIEAFRLNPSVEFFNMDAQSMNFPDRSFDVIISTENFEHLPDQAAHVREVARLVRKAGMCFIATPNPELFMAGEKNPFHTKENTYIELKELLLQGFRDVEILEPQRIPVNPVGRDARDKRFARGEHGKVVTPDMQIFGHAIDQTYLSNTHSFQCFARAPIH